MSKYFVIHPSDGETSITPFTKEELLELIKEDYWGPNKDWLNSTHNNNTNYWGDDGMLVIKGEIVQPEPKEVTIEYDIN